MSAIARSRTCHIYDVLYEVCPVTKLSRAHCRAPIPTRDTVFVFLYYHILKHTSERSFPFISHKIRM